MHDTGMAQYRHVYIGTTGAYPIAGEGGWERKLAQGAARVLRGRLALRPNEVSPRARLRTAVRSCCVLRSYNLLISAELLLIH